MKRIKLDKITPKQMKELQMMLDIFFEYPMKNKNNTIKKTNPNDNNKNYNK